MTELFPRDSLNSKTQSTVSADVGWCYGMKHLSKTVTSYIIDSVLGCFSYKLLCCQKRCGILFLIQFLKFCHFKCTSVARHVADWMPTGFSLWSCYKIASDYINKLILTTALFCRSSVVFLVFAFHPLFPSLMRRSACCAKLRLLLNFFHLIYYHVNFYEPEISIQRLLILARYNMTRAEIKSETLRSWSL